MSVTENFYKTLFLDLGALKRVFSSGNTIALLSLSEVRESEKKDTCK